MASSFFSGFRDKQEEYTMNVRFKSLKTKQEMADLINAKKKPSQKVSPKNSNKVSPKNVDKLVSAMFGK